MKKKNIIKKIVSITVRSFFFILTIIALLIACFSLSPWKVWIATQTENALRQQGFENPKLTIKAITPDIISLKDITIGTDKPIQLTNLDIGYDLYNLWNGRINNLSLSGLDLSLTRGDQGWQIQGFNMPAASNPENAANPKIPMTKEDMAALPFNALDIRDSHLTVSGSNMLINAPFSASLGQDVSMAADIVNIKYGAMLFKLTKANLSAHLKDDSQGWSGTWSVADISSPSMTSISASGTLTFNAQDLRFSGNVKAKDKSGAKASFMLRYDFASPDKMLLTLNAASMPWGGGVMSVKNVVIPVFGTKPITVPVQTRNVSIDDVMRMMTGEYVRATGSVSGTIPVVIKRNGTLSIGNGGLKANDQGSLSMPPNLIPGQGEQIEITRKILEDFQYKILDISIEKINDNKISVLLTIKGNNPTVYNGREVHLNVRLNGDLLEIVRSNVMLIFQPEALMKRK